MTIGHLVECLLSKLSTLTGVEGDATAFTDVTVEKVSNALAQYGYQKRGFEVLYNGHTGRKLQAQVYFGPTYYQRLKHMVDDKIHSRARGPVQILTRQPVEGRSRDGGLRFGEMERDCFIAHGAAQFLKVLSNSSVSGISYTYHSIQRNVYSTPPMHIVSMSAICVASWLLLISRQTYIIVKYARTTPRYRR